MRINTNTSALFSYGALGRAASALTKSIGRLSAGLRISSAADDAAGLAITEKMRAQNRGLDQAGRNAQDGISMIQTAEGALNETHSILQRMRELAVQAANDSLTQDDRQFIQLEIDELKSEIDRISNTTQFNRKKLLDGSSDVVWSTDRLGASLNVRGAVSTEGNFRVVVRAVDGGRGQVQKSNILTRMVSTDYDMDGENDGWEKRPATLSTHLSAITNFFDANGRSILADPQELKLSIESAGERTVTIYSEDTVESLGMKINAALMEASGQIPVGSMVQWIGAASAGGVTSIDAEPIAIYGDMLMTGLLENSGLLIKDKLGMQGNGASELYVALDPGSSRPTSTWYTVGGGAVDDALDMFVGEAFFTGMTDEKWEEAQIAALRETVRAMEYADQDLLGAMFDLTAASASKPPKDASWLHEGLIQYMAGGSSVAQRAFTGMDAAQVASAMRDAVGTGTDTGFSTSSPTYNAASYLAARFYDEQSGGKLKDLVGSLSGGAAIDAAIAATSGFGSMAGFRAAINGAAFETFVTKVLGEDTSIDGGFLGGQFASGGAAQTRAALAASLLGNNYKENPLKDLGFDHFEIYDYELSQTSSSGGGGRLSTSAPLPGTFQSVDGTLLLHSNIAGTVGRISLSGSEDLIKALGFTEIQSAETPIYEVTVFDAHSGATVMSRSKFSGTRISDAIPGADIDIPVNLALNIIPDGTRTGGYSTYRFDESSDEFIVHVADSSTVLQIGANEGERMLLSFGEVSSASLEIARLRVTDREAAARSVTLIDRAISEVSTRRSRLGAYQNRLEHTIANIAEASMNMKASESRIRDADMAREMMEYTKLNILYQAGSSMLQQANTMPQNILTLLR